METTRFAVKIFFATGFQWCQALQRKLLRLGLDLDVMSLTEFGNWCRCKLYVTKAEYRLFFASTILFKTALVFRVNCKSKLPNTCFWILEFFMSPWNPSHRKLECQHLLRWRWGACLTFPEVVVCAKCAMTNKLRLKTIFYFTGLLMLKHELSSMKSFP